jgi:ribonucleoside-diphosphate reductase alpha chain
MFAWESWQATSANVRMFKHIRTKLDEVNLEIGKERGEAPDAKGTGRRFSHVMAIAPNASSSIIMGNTSPSIEPYRANAYRQDTLSGSYLNKNRNLVGLIQSKIEAGETKQTEDEIWSSIISNDGSCQQLKFLTEDEKNVFKTAMEIDQRWIIDHASKRQEYIDQGQSLNLFFRPDVNKKYLHLVHFLAWKSGLKTLYYCRSEKIGKADKVSRKIEREIIKETNMATLIEDSTCLACEG